MGLGSEPSKRRLGRARTTELGSWLVALGLFVGTVVDLSARARFLWTGDEGLFLHQAKRISEGAVLYRDLFQFVAPASWYAMAAVFRVFGCSMATARIGMAVLQGLSVAVIYVACRALRVGAGLSAAPALAFLVGCEPVWPYASPHWFGTLLTLVLVCVLSRGACLTRPKPALLIGVVTGLLISVQQQRGAIIAAGVLMIVVVHHLVSRRRPGAPTWPTMPILLVAAGIAIVVVPVLVVLISQAGGVALFDDLVAFPLWHYPAVNWVPWGHGIFTRPRWLHAFLLVLKFSPVVGVVAIARAVLHLKRAQHVSHATRVVSCAILAEFSALSILYRPDMTHIAFIAPLFFVVGAEVLAWHLRMAPVAARALGGWPLALLLVAALGLHAGRNVHDRLQGFPLSYDTAFGQIQFSDLQEMMFVFKVRRLVQMAPSKDVFCYPACAGMYLMTGANNPTPYDWLQPLYNSPADFRQVLDMLEGRQVPYIVVVRFALAPDDPLLAYLRRSYEALPFEYGESPNYVLYRRKSRRS